MERYITIIINKIKIFGIISLIAAAALKVYDKISVKEVKPYIGNIIYLDKYPHEESLYNKNAANMGESRIPLVYQYRHINKEALKKWLINRNSCLADEPYFSAIIRSAEKYNINPCLLFAITGNEQNFVPKNNPYAPQIVNNPFNVYGSWKIYNTNITDSSEIACETIIKISSDRPYDVDYLTWLNLRNGTGGYAEDPHWHKGVEIFFKKLNSEV